MRLRILVQTTLIESFLKAVVIGSIHVFLFLLIIKKVNVHVTSSCLSDVERTTSCPATKNLWTASAIRKNCSKTPPNCNPLVPMKYHCLINAWRNSTFELCSHDTEIIGFSCAEYNEGGTLIQPNFENKCKNFLEPCPFKYNSSQGYLYPQCYELLSEELEGAEISPVSNETTNAPGIPEEDVMSTFGKAAPLLIFLLILIAFAIGVYMMRKCKFGSANNTEDIETPESQPMHSTTEQNLTALEQKMTYEKIDFDNE
ncbi:uncharacterized protein LOC134262652 [Saccostrea cucullata]|uniref:uncharacterized protein LOC134262652 n=1 Tax=Saccostrea cuccullata TaxID=36930 RepID=UPI002ED0F54D